ncbi:MAG TPA: alkaline phosphatase family protein, partial [Ktedonobacteraceae bacterium]|nr:alkaline phosphatase family protein [Ktedonobacteraceae bacterium]
MSKRKTQLFLVFLVCLLCLASAPFIASAQENNNNHSQQRHVLLLSIDGLHAQDLALYTRIHPHSALASLGKWGVTYTNASTTKPSDSFPGLLSMVTGGTPRSTGVFYDDSYDGNLSAPGSNCSTKGTEVVYDESIDYNSDALNAGGGINPQALPLDPAKGCTPVYPHSFLRVNTIFEVARAAGLRTAWSDKHPAYEILDGPSGKGVQDLFTPEINSQAAASGNDWTTDNALTQIYDSYKVQSVLNEIRGYDHSGTVKVGMPALFGMNFQTVSTAEKLPSGGYNADPNTPSPLLVGALNYI